MNLRTLFAIPIVIILIVTLSLAGMVAGQGWSGMVRGKAAIEAVGRMQLLLTLQAKLRVERVATNFVLGRPAPLADPVRQRLEKARQDTDEALRVVVTELHEAAGAIEAVTVNLDAVRSMIDQLLTQDLSRRTHAELETVMPRMLAVSRLVDGPAERVSLAVTAADESLSGLLTQDRLADSLRYQVGLIAAVLLPRFDKAEQPSAAEMDRVRILLDRAAYLTRLLCDTIEIAGATKEIRRSLADLGTIDVRGMLARLEIQPDAAQSREDDTGALLPQQLLLPWGLRIIQVRAALLDATLTRVRSTQAARERQFDLILTAFGVVMFAIMESAVLLSQRIVGPLAQLGMAITRIAAGDRGTVLNLHSGTREINEMVTAVETLRQAALVADATALRHRLVARQRLEMLREALGIARTVQEPAHALERGVASLSEGIDATIALLTSTSAAPATLCFAATAVRAGLAEMRDSAAELDATFAAAALTTDRPEAEFVAHILALRTQVDRREAMVRGFVLPSLVALRDAAAANREVSGFAVRDLVSDQFARVEETVSVISAMLATITRASAMVRDLPMEDATPMAA